jgi:hypothetical protein
MLKTIAITSGGGGNGTVTNVATGTGLTGGPITTTGTIALANTTVTAGTYGNSSAVSQVVINAQGQVTNAVNVAISIANSAVTGLGTMSTQAANNVAITGGAISGTTITALDNALTLQNAADTTKQSTFSLALITTGTSVVYTMPAVTGTIAALNGSNVWTANNIFSAVNGTFGSSGAAGTIQVASGATVSGNTKTVNIGTGGVSGSITNITVGTNISGSTSTTTMNGVVKRQVYTVATLPSASTSGLGATAFVSDALSPAFGATVATGGAVAVPVYSDGTNWKVG